MTDQQLSAARSFNILKKFTRIPDNNLGELKPIIDDPSNGVVLFRYFHYSFSQLHWCLEPTHVENQYNLRLYHPANPTLRDYRPSLDNHPVGFTDSSQASCSMVPSIEPFPDPIPLSDRHLVSICAVIGEIFHQGGAGDFLDSLLPPNPREPVHSWQELEEIKKLEEEMGPEVLFPVWLVYPMIYMRTYVPIEGFILHQRR
ncbi:hypothetical protein M413DRAFT_449670 [Hebeloma cylindrosporum]|uniref:HNH nuclease domain-containing protein n=1 Tax=Hebeloma cylindrosporum TaxID=76867 RepID=A0A0C3BU99_HEBCY|nr:hypothetical protein M413DRAFT_449670 [Hebeloma cylindrosporum h7]